MKNHITIFVLFLFIFGATYAQEAPNRDCSPISSFPWTEGFENNGDNLPPGWERQIIAGSANWNVVPGNSYTPNTAYAGNRKALFIFWQAGNSARLITPALDLTSLTNPTLAFWHAQEWSGPHWPDEFDKLRVYYKTSATGTWTLLQEFNHRIPNWTEARIPLPNPTNDYYIAFEAECRYGEGIHLDEVSVFDFVEDFTDAELAQIFTPTAGLHYDLTSSEPVKVLIRNNGVAPISGFDLKLELDGVTVTTETYSGVIASSDTASYIFSVTLDLSAAGEYNVTVTVLVENDQVPGNDSRTVVVENVVCTPVSTFPWIEGFEGNLFPPLCWTSHNKGSSWQRSTSFAYNGLASARYDFGELGWLITRKIAVPNDGIYALDFWSYNQFSTFNFYNAVWISTTNNDTTSFVEVKQLFGEHEISDNWKKIRVSLQAYAGQEIYIAFKYIGDIADIWHIDDVTVLNVSDFIDAEVAWIIEPNSDINLTNAEAVTVLIKNNGGAPLTEFELELSHNGNFIVSETYTDILGSLSQVEYTFVQTLDLSAAGDHHITVKVTAVGDENPDNDVATKTVTNTFCPLITTFPWIENFDSDISCWRRVDSDGDGDGWLHMSLNFTNGVMASFSAYYITEAGTFWALTPDNWLISPQMALHATGEHTLSFLVGSVDFPTRYAEKYSVLVSTTGYALENFTPIHTETLTETGLKTVTLSLGEYAGETVYIAFRHWDCTDQYVLILDDVEVRYTQNIKEQEVQHGNPLKAWINNDKLHIGGLIFGEQFSVYNIMGALVHQSIANNDVMEVGLNARGMYVIRSEKHALKIVY
ncbi:MAG: choice-of-anchor J domain-containing protein [Bacteroidetes bacterium]|nr:choice-of-anchor J domain-containing protein [Bacteroidota bacterium]MCL2301937.1 choice-of-anchor J domain-containing protein [Lentimicrobiaceae bacterium]